MQATYQFPVLRLKSPIHSPVFFVACSTCIKHSAHEMVISGVCMAVLWMLHEPCHATSQLRPIILRDDVLYRLAKLQCPVTWRRFLRKVVPVAQHRCPQVAVEVMDSSS